MIRQHFDAVVSLLSDLPMQFYAEGQVPDRPTFPYAVLHVAARSEGQSKVSGHTDALLFRFQVTSVGLTATASTIVADAVRSLLVDVRPSVAGRNTGRIKPRSSLPVTQDETFIDPATGLHPAMTRDTYAFESRPTS